MKRISFLLAALFLSSHLQGGVDQALQWNRAELLYEEGDYFEAAALYRTLEEGPEVLLKLASALSHAGKMSEAAAILTRVDPQLIQHQYLKKYLTAVCLRGQGRPDEAAAILENLPLSHPSVHYELGAAYAQMQEYTKARRHLSAAGTVYPLIMLDIAEEKWEEAEERLQNWKVPAEEAAFLKGKIAFLKKDYQAAEPWFARLASLPNFNKSGEAAYYLACCYRHTAPFSRAEAYFRHLLAVHPEERLALGLGELYLAEPDEETREKGEALLSDNQLIKSDEGKIAAIKARAAACSSYEGRDALYKMIENPQEALFLQGTNHYHEAEMCKIKGDSSRALELCDLAVAAFEQAFCLSPGTATAKNHLKALMQNQKKAAWRLLYAWKKENPELFVRCPDEFDFLQGSLAAQLGQYEEAIRCLESSLERQGRLADRCMFLMGAIYFQTQHFDKAEALFGELINHYPRSVHIPEALFREAECIEMLDSKRSAFNLRQRLCRDFPRHALAPSAYFRQYHYQDYLEGGEAPISHLKQLPELFPDSPLALNALYLMGLDYMRDRRDEAGRWISKQNLNAAIDHFLAVENRFALEKIPCEEQRQYIQLLYKARLERGRASLAVAEQSAFAKKEVHLALGEQTFRAILQECADPCHPLAARLCYGEAYPSLAEEADYWLVQAALRAGNDGKADARLDSMITKYREAKITRGYYLSHVWYEKGLIAMRRKNYPEALEHFCTADASASKSILGSEQTLNIWIQQGLALMEMNALDEAMLVMSRAINEDAISANRVRAMLCRAEIYKRQGRMELAQKQLVATASKGGDWAKEAINTLEREYGHRF